MKRTLSILLSLILAFSMIGFAATAEDEITHITVYNFYPNTQTFDGWLNTYFEKTLGIHLDVIVADNEKLQTMIAGESLPDMGNFRLNNTIENAMMGDLLVNLDDYADQLPNIYERFPTVVEHSKAMFSCGK